MSKTRHRRRNVYGREGGTVREAGISQTRHRRRNVDGREGRTASEAVISQSRHRRRNVNGCEGKTVSEAVISQTRHAICNIVIRNVFGNDYFRLRTAKPRKLSSLRLSVQIVLESFIGTILNDFCIRSHTHYCKQSDEHASHSK